MKKVNIIKCSACEKTYSDKTGLKRHMERDHEGITTLLSSKTACMDFQLDMIQG